MSDLDFPARPVYTESAPAHEFAWPNGLTKREHAAIELRVPLSGNAELDAMILASRRLDIATAAMQGMYAHEDSFNGSPGSRDVLAAFSTADAMLREAGFAPGHDITGEGGAW